MIRRGEIYWVNLDPTVGSEIKNVRPALIVSNDQNNQHANTVTVLPISSQVKHNYPFEVSMKQGEGGVDKDSKIMANQIRTVDKRRLRGAPLGDALNTALMDAVEKAIKLHLSLHWDCCESKPAIRHSGLSVKRSG